MTDNLIPFDLDHAIIVDKLASNIINNLFPAPRIIERWQNVYKAIRLSSLFESKEEADEVAERGTAKITRTHYLKTYWGEDGVILTNPGPELIKIGNS